MREPGTIETAEICCFKPVATVRYADVHLVVRVHPRSAQTGHSSRAATFVVLPGSAAASRDAEEDA